MNTYKITLHSGREGENLRFIKADYFDSNNRESDLRFYNKENKVIAMFSSGSWISVEIYNTDEERTTTE